MYNYHKNIKGIILLHKPRRTFMKATFLTTAVLFISSCDILQEISPLQTIDLVQADLFPFADELNVDVLAYLTIIDRHSRVSDEDKKFLRNGVKWLNEEAVLEYDRVYTKLSSSERQKLLKIVSKEKWGESWINTLLSYTMEAIFSDKIYGVNPKESAHKWLTFDMGLPRPTEALL